MAGEKKQERDTADPGAEPSATEAQSGPRPKDPGEDVAMILGSFEARSQGLDGEELEEEIERLLRLLIERHVKALPERLKEQGRELVRTELARDPALQAMIADLRDAARQRS